MENSAKKKYLQSCVPCEDNASGRRKRYEWIHTQRTLKIEGKGMYIRNAIQIATLRNRCRGQNTQKKLKFACKSIKGVV